MAQVKPMGHGAPSAHQQPMQHPLPPENPLIQYEPGVRVGEPHPPTAPESQRDGEGRLIPTPTSAPYDNAFAAAFAANAAKQEAWRTGIAERNEGLRDGLVRGFSGTSGVPAANAPMATAVHITGTAAVGQNLTGNYTYYDEEGNPEGASTFAWLRNNVAIAGATAKVYALVGADQFCDVAFRVIPRSSVAPLVGAPATSPAVYVAA